MHWNTHTHTFITHIHTHRKKEAEKGDTYTHTHRITENAKKKHTRKKAVLVGTLSPVNHIRLYWAQKERKSTYIMKHRKRKEKEKEQHTGNGADNSCKYMNFIFKNMHRLLYHRHSTPRLEKWSVWKLFKQNNNKYLGLQSECNNT